MKLYPVKDNRGLKGIHKINVRSIDVSLLGVSILRSVV